MRAKSAFRLIVGRDTVEVVDIADGETLFLWDLAPSEMRRFTRVIREELHAMDADDFRARWAQVETSEDL